MGIIITKVTISMLTISAGIVIVLTIALIGGSIDLKKRVSPWEYLESSFPVLMLRCRISGAFSSE
jgi:hypothetical protein